MIQRNKNMKKKILLTFMSILISVFAFSAINVSAATSGTCGDNLVWTLDDYGTLTISGSGDMATYSSPSSVPWYANRNSIYSVIIDKNITTIGSNAFYYCKNLTNINFPNSLTTIGSSAFNNCTALTSVTIGDNVSEIGSYAFSGCTTLTDVTIGKNVISIGVHAFNNCANVKNVYITDLTKWSNIDFMYSNNPLQSGAKLYLNGNLVSSLTIPSGITEIKDCAFYGCSSITSVSIPNGVTTIGGRAFQKCINIKSISLPNTLTTIDSIAFANCTSLQSITIPNSVTTIKNDAFSCCESLSSITIPNSVTTLGGSAFYNCKNLQQINWNAINIADFGYYGSPFSNVGTNTNGVKVVIGTGVKKIPAYAFASSTSDISKITSVTLSNTVTDIGASAFSGCKNLTSVTIPSGVVSVGESAFSDCISLKSISIPNSVTSLGHSVFSNCTGLNNVILGNGISIIRDRTFYGCTSLTNITIPNSVTAIELYAFANSGLKSIIIPSSVSSIGRFAFLGCASMSSATIANGVNTIGEYAFSDCESLTTISIPNSITNIDIGAFSGCNSLTKISFGSGITNIGGYSLCYCENLQEIVVNDNNQYYSSVDGVLFNKAKNEIICYPAKKGGIYCIPNSVTSIAESAFYNCINLESVTIPHSVTEIGNYAFRECTNIIEINWNAETVSNFSSNNYVFYNTGKNGNGINLKFGSGVTAIPSYAFYPYSNYSTYSPKITSVTLPDTINSIGAYAFQYCSNIKTVNYNGNSSTWSKISIGSYNSYLSSASRKYFYYVTLYDKNSNIISSKVQNKGEIVDTSSVSNVPIGYNIVLYKDSELTEEYNIITPINENLNLYVDIYHPLLNKVKITGMDQITVGDNDVKYTLTLATDKDVNALYCFIKYPDTLKLKTVTAKDFVFAGLEDEYTEGGFTTAVILAQYSETDLISKNEILTPFELTFDVSKSAIPGTIQIEATEESCLIGNETHFFEERISGSLEILPKLAEGIEISGADVISSVTTYTAIITPDYTTDKTVEWSVDDETIATVDENGVVTPVTSGTFILTATAKDGSGVTASKTITVTQGVTSIEISGTDSITEATTYSVIITPNYATNKEVEWSISNSEIAIVDQNGLVTPITSGIVTITATAKDGSGISASKEINIIKLAESIVITGEDSISSPAQYTATVSPDYTSDKEVNWSVDNKEIATVDENGIVTPVTSGTVILTATTKDGSGVSNNKIIEIVKFAESIEIIGSEEITEPSQYSVVILPEYTTNKEAEWTVSDETIATVDENGLVTPLKNGKIVLTAKALDASGIETTKSIVITVSIRANSITSDVGIWDKEFDSDITEYTINVPSGTTAIYLTSSFENATAKVNGSVALNGVRKKVTLTGKETDIELVLTPTSGNNLSANTYKITVICGSFTKTTVSNDGKSFTVVPVNIENGKTVILALYDGEKFIEMQSAVYTGEEIPFITTKAYTNAKVMVWNDLRTLKPVCNVEIVK